MSVFSVSSGTVIYLHHLFFVFSVSLDSRRSRGLAHPLCSVTSVCRFLQEERHQWQSFAQVIKLTVSISIAFICIIRFSADGHKLLTDSQCLFHSQTCSEKCHPASVCAEDTRPHSCTEIAAEGSGDSAFWKSKWVALYTKTGLIEYPQNICGCISKLSHDFWVWNVLIVSVGKSW